MFYFHFIFIPLILINCHVEALAHLSLLAHCFVISYVTIVLRISFLTSYEGVWEDSSFSPKKHNVKKEFEAKTEIFFYQRKQVSQCQLVNIIGSLVALFTAFPSVYFSPFFL